jgi:phosphoglucosamine mutase
MLDRRPLHRTSCSNSAGLLAWFFANRAGAVSWLQGYAYFGYMFESALQAGISAAGADVALLGPMPTPGIAYLTRTFKAEAGIVISASHNPHYDNGIKFFSSTGQKLPDATEQMIEELIDAPMHVVDSEQLGKASRIVDAAGRYIEFCKSSVPTSTDFSGFKVVIDCAHGATYRIAPSVFSELGGRCDYHWQPA